MTLPASFEGYAVDVDAGIVHHRWAEHAIGLPRTRIASGVWALLGYEGTACGACFPTEAELPQVPAITADVLDVMPPRPYRRRRPLVEDLVTPDPEAGS